MQLDAHDDEDQWVLRQSDAWSEDSMDSRSLSLSSGVEQSCLYRSRINHSMFADSANEPDGISIHCVHWEDRLLDGQAALLKYHAC